MSNITVTMKDGEVKKFFEEHRAGGSYRNTLKCEGACLIIEDQWGVKTYIPLADVKEVVEVPTRR